MRIRIKGFLSILLSVALVMGMLQDVKLAAGAENNISDWVTSFSVTGAGAV